MTRNKQEADTIDFTKARLVSTYNELGRHLAESDDIISRLTRRLQTTLDIKYIINMFVEEVGKLINFDQFEYILLDSMFHFGKREREKEDSLMMFHSDLKI